MPITDHSSQIEDFYFRAQYLCSNEKLALQYHQKTHQMMQNMLEDLYGNLNQEISQIDFNVITKQSEILNKFKNILFSYKDVSELMTLYCHIVKKLQDLLVQRSIEDILEKELVSTMMLMVTFDQTSQQMQVHPNLTINDSFIAKLQLFEYRNEELDNAEDLTNRMRFYTLASVVNRAKPYQDFRRTCEDMAQCLQDELTGKTKPTLENIFDLYNYCILSKNIWPDTSIHSLLPTLNALAKSADIIHISYIDMECLIKYLTHLYHQQEFSDSNSQIKTKFSGYLIDLASQYSDKPRYADYSQESLKRLKSTQICNLINHQTTILQLKRYITIILTRLSELTEIIEHVETRSIDAKIQHVCDVINLCSTHDPLAAVIPGNIATLRLYLLPEDSSKFASYTETLNRHTRIIHQSVQTELQKKIKQLISKGCNISDDLEKIHIQYSFLTYLHRYVQRPSSLHSFIAQEKRALYDSIYTQIKNSTSDNIGRLQDHACYQLILSMINSNTKSQLESLGYETESKKKNLGYQRLDAALIEVKYRCLYPDEHDRDYDLTQEVLVDYILAYNSTNDEQILTKLFLFIHFLTEINSSYEVQPSLSELFSSFESFFQSVNQINAQKVSNNENTRHTTLITLLGATLSTNESSLSSVASSFFHTTSKLSPDDITQALQSLYEMNVPRFSIMSPTNTLFTQLINVSNKHHLDIKERYQQVIPVTTSDKLCKINMVFPKNNQNLSRHQLNEIKGFLEEYPIRISMDISLTKKINIIIGLSDYMLGFNQIIYSMHQITNQESRLEFTQKLSQMSNQFIQTVISDLIKIEQLITSLADNHSLSPDDNKRIFWALTQAVVLKHKQNNHELWRDLNVKYDLPCFIWKAIAYATATIGAKKDCCPIIKSQSQNPIPAYTSAYIIEKEKNHCTSHIYMSTQGLIILGRNGVRILSDQTGSFCLWSMNTELQPPINKRYNQELSIRDFIYIHSTSEQYESLIENDNLNSSKLLFHNLSLYHKPQDRIRSLEILYEIMKIKKFNIILRDHLNYPLCILLFIDSTDNVWREYYESPGLSDIEIAMVKKIIALRIKNDRNYEPIFLHTETDISAHDVNPINIQLYQFAKQKTISIPIIQSQEIVSTLEQILSQNTLQSAFHIWLKSRLQSKSKKYRKILGNFLLQLTKIHKLRKNHKIYHLIGDANLSLNIDQGIKIHLKETDQVISFSDKELITQQIAHQLNHYLSELDRQLQLHERPTHTFQLLASYLQVCIKLSATPFEISKECTDNLAEVMYSLISEKKEENSFTLDEIIKAYEQLLTLNVLKRDAVFCERYSSHLVQIWGKTKDQPLQHIDISQRLNIIPFTKTPTPKTFSEIYDLFRVLLSAKTNLNYNIILENHDNTSQALQICREAKIKLSQKVLRFLIKKWRMTQKNDFISHLQISSFLGRLPFKGKHPNARKICQHLWSYIHDEAILNLPAPSELSEEEIYTICIKIQHLNTCAKTAHLQYIFDHSQQQNKHPDHFNAAKTLGYIPFSASKPCEHGEIYDALISENYDHTHPLPIEVHVGMIDVIENMNSQSLRQQQNQFLETCYHQSKTDINQHLKWCQMMNWQPYKDRPKTSSKLMINEILDIIKNPGKHAEIPLKPLVIIMCHAPDKFESQWLKKFLNNSETTIDLQNQALSISYHNFCEEVPLSPRSIDNCDALIQAIQAIERTLIKNHLQSKLTEYGKDYKVKINTHVSIHHIDFHILTIPVKEFSNNCIDETIIPALNTYHDQDIDKVIECLAPPISQNTKETLLKLKNITSNTPGRWYITGGFSYLIKNPDVIWAPKLMPKQLLLGFDGNIDELKTIINLGYDNYTKPNEIVIKLESLRIRIKANTNENTLIEGFPWQRLNHESNSQFSLPPVVPTTPPHEAKLFIIRAYKYCRRGVITEQYFNNYLFQWKIHFQGDQRRFSHAELCFNLMIRFQYIDIDLLLKSIYYLFKTSQPHNSTFWNACVQRAYENINKPFCAYHIIAGMLDEYSEYYGVDKSSIFIETWERDGLLPFGTTYTSAYDEWKSSITTRHLNPGSLDDGP